MSPMYSDFQYQPYLNLSALRLLSFQDMVKIDGYCGVSASELSLAFFLTAVSYS